MWFICIIIFALFAFLHRPRPVCEGFTTPTLRKYTLSELACALRSIKTYLEKDGDPIYLIEVKDVAFSTTSATIVCVAFNKKTFTTKMYKATVKGEKVTRITDNVIEFDESFLEHNTFGKPMGIHESEQLHKVPFMTSDIAKLSRYTFAKVNPVEQHTMHDKDDTAIAALALHKLKSGSLTTGVLGGDDIRAQLAYVLSNPEMRKYVTIQSLRNM